MKKIKQRSFANNFVGCNDDVIAFKIFPYLLKMHIKMFIDDMIFLRLKNSKYIFLVQ